MKNLTAVEQMYEQLEVNDPAFWNVDMIRDWFIENKQRFLQMEKEQIEAAWWSGHDERNESPVIHPSEDCNGYYNETYKK